MTQLFFDIGSLANYFIANKDKSAAMTGSPANDGGFQSCLKTLSIIGGHALNEGSQLKTDSSNQASGAVQKGDPADSSFDLASALIAGATFNIAASSIPIISTIPEAAPDDLTPQSELRASTSSVRELIELLKATPQTVTLQVSSFAPPVENASIRAAYHHGKSGVINQAAELEKLLAMPTNSGLLQSVLPGFELGGIQKANAGLPGRAGVVFSTEQLLLADDQPITVRAVGLTNTQSAITLPAAVVKQWVRDYPAKIMIEMKMPDSVKTGFSDSTGSSIPQKNISALDGFNYNVAGVRSAVNETAIFDLRSLLSEHATDIVHVVLKSTMPKEQSSKSSPGDQKQTGNGQAENIQKSDLLSSIRMNSGDRQNGVQLFDPAQRTGMSTKSAVPPNDARANATMEGAETEYRRRPGSPEKHDNIGPETNGKNPASDKGAGQFNKATVVSKPADTKPDDFGKFDFQFKARPIQVSANGNEGVTARTPDISMIELADKIIDQLRGRFMMTPLNSQLSIRLKPESLGQIKIDLKYEGDKIEALFRVQNPDVKAILEAEMPRLRHEWKIDSYKIEMESHKSEDNSSTMHNRNGYSRTPANRRPAGYVEDGLSGELSLDKINGAPAGNAGAYRIGKINLLI